MVPKKYRLNNKKDFFEVKSFGTTYKSASFYITFIFKDSFKFKVLVSNKISKKAVERNKLRRKIQSSVLKNASNLNLWFILTPTHKIINKDYETINSEIVNFIQKVSVSR
jgi:ribonuclease P protein component